MVGQEFDKLLESYISNVKRATSEANKSFFFIELVRNSFKANIDYLEELFPHIEKFVKFKTKTVVSKGRIDSLLGNVIIEFESDIKRKKIEAESQLRRYVSILWNKDIKELKKRVNYLTIASDGIFFYVYRPETTKEGELTEGDIELILIEEFAIEKRSPTEFFIWLDYTFLSKEMQAPTTEDFKNVFGVSTPLYKIIISELKKAVEKFKVEQKDTYDTLFSEWSKYLSIAYGSRIESEEYFIKHTYLSLLSKLMIFNFYSKSVLPIEDDTFLDILSGKEFQKWQLKNFFEEDFFCWIIRDTVKEHGINIARHVSNELKRYDLTQLNEDILKGLYENLLDEKERHDLGETYTPDWLAEYMLRDLLKNNPKKSVLDTACGSGTFLFITIKLKKEFLNLDNLELLYHILENVKGIDIHPLAVLIAKTNYVLALGNLIRTVGRGEVILPIYMADSIRLIDENKGSFHSTHVYKIPTIDNKQHIFSVPVDFIEKQKLKPEKIDDLIDLIKELGLELFNTGKFEKDGIRRFLHEHLENGENPEKYVDVLIDDVEIFAEIIKKNRDTIWGYILKNKHKPIDFTHRKFDLIVGNPPWVVYNSIKNVDYQRFLKKLIIEYYNLTASAELITNMEMATLFFARCSELYLKDDGTIAFVMPRSIFSADQHSDFRNNSFKKVKLGFYKIFDLENVKPLFKTRACVVFANNNTITSFPITAEIISGNLEIKNESYESAIKSLQVSTEELFLSKIGKRDFFSQVEVKFEGERSYYYDKFFRGAEVLPQTFWIVNIIASQLGYDAQKPYIKTSGKVVVNAKEPWKEIIFEGNIESDFLYDGVIGSDIFPFSYITDLFVLPIQSERNNFILIESSQIGGRYPYLAKWLKKAEDAWAKGRGEKLQFDIYKWINYSNKLTRQNPSKKFKVMYNKTGKDIVSAVVETSKHNGRIILGEATIYFETDNEDEAYYLQSVLNSPIVNTIIKPMQAKGLFGERGIEKKVLELPIPKYTSKNESHYRLAEIGKSATMKAQQKLDEILKEYQEVLKPQHIGRIRKEIRDYLSPELNEINGLVKIILHESSNEEKGLNKFIG